MPQYLIWVEYQDKNARKSSGWLTDDNTSVTLTSEKDSAMKTEFLKTAVSNAAHCEYKLSNWYMPKASVMVELA